MSKTEQKAEMTENELVEKWVGHDFHDGLNEEFISDLRSVIRGETSELLKQRDELLEALKRVRVCSNLITSFDIIQAAITKAEER